MATETNTNKDLTNLTEEELLMRRSSVFWIEVDKIEPNPFQPRTEFDEGKLKDLAESIRIYGVLQPLVVTRKEVMTEQGVRVRYELIAGERRLRASKMAGLIQVPVIIKSEMADKVKLELAIIENLQREDLNPVERALAFKQLIDEFNLKHAEIGARVGKSRVFVTNTIRILALPPEMIQGLREGKINEGHTRPLLMLVDNKEEQQNLFNRIINTKMTVREAERASRFIAKDRARKKNEFLDRRTRAIEARLSEVLGTKVHIEQSENKDRGRISIDYFSDGDLDSFLAKVAGKEIISEVDAIAESEIENSGEESVRSFVSDDLDNTENGNNAEAESNSVEILSAPGMGGEEGEGDCCDQIKTETDDNDSIVGDDIKDVPSNDNDSGVIFGDSDSDEKTDSFFKGVFSEKSEDPRSDLGADYFDLDDFGDVSDLENEDENNTEREFDHSPESIRPDDIEDLIRKFSI